MLAQAVCLTVLRHLAGTSSLGSPTTLGAASCSLSSGGALHCLETLRMNVTAKRRCTALLPTVVPAEARKDLATPRTADSTMRNRLKKRGQRERKSIALHMTQAMRARMQENCTTMLQRKFASSGTACGSRCSSRLICPLCCAVCVGPRAVSIAYAGQRWSAHMMQTHWTSLDPSFLRLRIQCCGRGTQKINARCWQL